MSKTIGLVLALKDECSPKLKEVADKIGVTEKELKRANQSIKKFQKELGTGIKNACKVAMVGLGALATATVATVQQTMKHGDEIDEMSQKMQMSRKAYQELDYVFSQNGADISMMQTGMSKLTKAMDGAKIGTKSYILTFNRLGISLKDTKGRMKSTETVMFEALNKLQKMPEGATKTALALQLFGKSATELAPLLNGNAKGVEELRKKFNDLGMGMSDEEVNASVKFTDTMDTLNRTFQGCVYTVGADLMPIFQSLADAVQSNMPKIKATVIPVFKGVAGAIKFVTENINWLLPVATGLLTTFLAYSGITKTIAVIELLKNTISAVNIVQGVWNALMLANPIGVIAVGVGALVGAIALLIVNWDKVTEAIRRATDAIRKFLGENEKTANAKYKAQVERVKSQPKYVVDSRGKAWDKSQYKIEGGRAVKIDGSHANGLSNVPFNGYVAELHKGERVLTASENRNYNTTTNTQSTNKTVTINFYGDIIGNGEFLNKIKFELGQELKKALAT